VRRRVTDAFAWLGARPAAAETASTATVAPWETAAGQGAPGREGGVGWGDGGWAANGNGAAPSAAGNGTGPSGKSHTGRNKALVAGAGIIAVVAVAGVIVTPKLLGSTDPGCKAYSGTTLTAYNKTIGDLNKQSSQAELRQDMTTTINDLTQAVGQANRASVKSALNGLLTELKTVQADIDSGSVPDSTVSGLNHAATTADGAC
jgi:hypothetical protein